MTKLGVLLSGRGSNYRAIQEQCHDGRIDAAVSVVISNKPSAGGLDIAREFSIPAHCINPTQFSSQEEYEAAIVDVLVKAEVDWVILAGYMKIVGTTILQAFKDKIINIHPSLLPSFKGLNAQKQAFDYGVTISGCSVHFVDESLDGGPIIAQTAVPVLPTDNIDDLSQRILTEEHQLYPRVIQALANGLIECKNGTVIRQIKESF